jgi:hypothetical protein
LKDQLQLLSLQRAPYKLKSILEPLVSSHGIITEETLDRLYEGNAMNRKFVSLEIIFEIPRLKSMPVDHSCAPQKVLSYVSTAGLAKTARKQQSMIQIDKWQP